MSVSKGRFNHQWSDHLVCRQHNMRLPLLLGVTNASNSFALWCHA